MAATEGRLTNRSRLPGHALRLHRPVVPLLRDLLERTGSERIVDLCSGGSGPLLAVVRELRESGLEVRAGARQPIAVFEIPERTLSVVLSTLLAPFMVLVATPFIRPFRWGRLVYTYLLPLVPLTCLWDGVVSQLRAYTPDELDRLADDVSMEYAWASGKVAVGGLPARLTYLIGHPQTRLPSGVE